MDSRLKIPPNAKILVADLAFIGDLLMSTPALANLRRAFPDARIDIVVAPASRPVIEHNPDVNWVLTTGLKSGGFKALRAETERISREKYDLAISFHRAHGTLLMLKLAGIPRRIGFTNEGRRLLLTAGIPFQLYRHRAWNHIRLIEKCLGIDADYKIPTRLSLDPQAVERIGKRLDEAAPGARLAAVNPNASWPTKRWPAERFAEVADRLAATGFQTLLIGSPSDKPISDTVKSMMTSNPLDFTGETTLPELAALISRCEILVTNDSGPMHIAQAVGTPVVSVFGPTDPARCGPWLSETEPLQAGIDCIKCYRKSCWHLRCMRQVTSESVIRVARSCLGM